MFAERSSILSQVAAGQMTAEEAIRRLRSAPVANTERLKGRWLRIRVTRLSTGRGIATINLPLTWVEIGMRIGARYENRLAGVDWGEVVDLVRSGADGRLVEVENLEDDKYIEISVE